MARYSDVESGAGQPWFDSLTCLDADPQFVDALMGDYRFMSTSPCIDAGTNQPWMIGATDLNGNPRIAFGIVDMGAFEIQVHAPEIVQQPASRTNAQGSGATFTLSATGTKPLSYQWYRDSLALSNGVYVAGATTATLTLSGVSSNDIGSYTVVVANLYGSATGGPASLTVTWPTERALPKIMILTPKTGWETNQNVITVNGTAADKAPGAIARVLVRVNSKAWQLATMSRANPRNLIFWTNVVTLVAGTNWVEVKAEDTSLNQAVATAQCFLQVASPLTLVTNGNGNLTALTSPPVPPDQYYVGCSYSLSCVPLAGNLFSNVMANGTTVLYSATPDKTAQLGAPIRFMMQTNLTLTGNFMSNRFIGAAGNYYGLFSDPAGVAHASAGFLTFKTTSKLTFTGSLYVEGEKVNFAGGFDLAGVGTLKKWVTRKGMGHEPLDIEPVLDLEGGQVMSGTVSSPSNGWTANLLADMDVYSATNPPPATLTGQYTMILPGSTNVAVEPGGDGYSLITIAAGGNGEVWISAAGYSGDGEKVKPIKVPPSQAGRWPFYAPMYKFIRTPTAPASLPAPTYLGSVQGWLEFTNSNLQGDLDWDKVAGWTNGIYDGGFSNRITVTGSPYVPPAPLSGVHVIGITNGLAMLADGNLGAPVATEFYWTDVNKLVFSKGPTIYNPKALALTVNYKNGEVKGTLLLNPPDTLSKRNIYGAVLQNLNLGFGNFKGTNQTGAFRLQED